MKDYAFLFPGQGSQTVGMGKDLFENTDIGRQIFKMADDILGYSLSKICFEGPEDELKLTYNAQPAILTVSYIIFRLLNREPGIAAGHSLGEYSALTCAGAIRYEDAVLAVHKRGKYMQEAVPVGMGKMAALMGAEMDKIRDVIAQTDGVVDIANWNGSTQIVISGEAKAVETAVEKIAARKTTYLPVSAPFHSRLMLPAEEKLSADLDQITFNPLQFPVVNNVAAEAMTSGDEAREALKKQVSRPVLWHTSMERLLSQHHIARFAELGAGKVLTGLVKRAAKDLNIDIETINYENLENLK